MAKKQVDVSKIYGRIQFVRSFPDYKVKVVDHFPDLKVKKVNHFPTKAGLWKIVNRCPDYKIQIVCGNYIRHAVFGAHIDPRLYARDNVRVHAITHNHSLFASAFQFM